jgi:type IV pilus assembly protein PilY1
MGRGLYVINALDGSLIWSATPSCAGATDSATCKYTPGMTHSIPSDIRFVDRDSNGYTDKLYFGDMGGNVWRADVSTDLTTSWTVTKLAALGCATGACASGTTPRKFFFPPEVLTIKDVGATGSYDAVFIASGDREHPLRSLATGSSYNVSDKAFMIKDTGTTLGTPATSGVTLATLFNATSTAYDSTLNGFYINFATGEKAVNAPLAVNGMAFFATNRPVDRSNSCAANLGEAKAYAVSPFTAAVDTNVLAGGGLPPGAVTGLVTVTNADGTSSTTRLCIGCGGVGGDAGAAKPANVGGLENTPPAVTIDKNLKRTYWYKK